MELEINVGICGKQEVVVDQNNTATALGSGDVPVFATPAMIALMEKTANDSVKQYMPENHVSVGIEINAQHIKATPIGGKVTCESFLSKVEGRKLVFNMTVYDGDGKVGEATHSRVVVDKDRFLGKIKND